MISEHLPVMQEERGKSVIFAVGKLRNLCSPHPSLFLSIFTSHVQCLSGHVHFVLFSLSF